MDGWMDMYVLRIIPGWTMGTHVSFIFRGYNPYIGGYNPLTNHLLTFWDIQVSGQDHPQFKNAMKKRLFGRGPTTRFVRGLAITMVINHELGWSSEYGWFDVRKIRTWGGSTKLLRAGRVFPGKSGKLPGEQWSTTPGDCFYIGDGFFVSHYEDAY